MDGEKLSVHMEDWQKADMSLVNEDLEHSMHLIQNIIEIVATESEMAAYARRIVRFKDGLLDSDVRNEPLALRREAAQAGAAAGQGEGV